MYMHTDKIQHCTLYEYDYAISPPPPPLSLSLSLFFLTPQIQEQIIEDIMGLEEKFGDYGYLDSGMMAPQTVSFRQQDIVGGCGLLIIYCVGVVFLSQ